jgi:hypothetical protein
MDNSYQKTTTQQLPQHGRVVKKKGLQKLGLRPDTNVPKTLDFNLEGEGTPPLASDNMGLFKQR